MNCERCFTPPKAQPMPWCRRCLNRLCEVCREAGCCRQIPASTSDRHLCEMCNPDMVKEFGRDAFCDRRMAENIEDQLNEDSDEGRAIRAEIAKEEKEEKLS